MLFFAPPQPQVRHLEGHVVKTSPYSGLAFTLGQESVSSFLKI